MKQRFILVLSVLALSVCKPSTVAAQVNVQDSLALVDLYNSTDGSMWYNHENWLTASPVQTWYGITVSGDRVIYIGFYSNYLGGSLPSSLGNLTNLQQLNLTFNHISGSIPSSLGNLTNLTFLSLSFNQFTGNIPSQLGNLTNLQSLETSYNWILANMRRAFIL